MINNSDGKPKKNRKPLYFILGLVIFLSYVVGERRFEKEKILSWEFSGVVSTVKFYRADVIFVIVNSKEYDLSRYGLFVKILDGYMEDGDGNETYKQTCIIENGDSLIKKKGQWPILLIKKPNKRIYLKCEFDDPIWFYQNF